MKDPVLDQEKHEEKAAKLAEQALDEPSLMSKFGSEKSKQALEVAEEAREKVTQPSFAAQLFMGTFRPDMLLPFPFQDEEDKKIGDEFLGKFISFLTENLDPDEVDRTYEIPKKVFEGLAELGVFALKVPKEYGGMGFSQTNYNRVCMAAASYCASTTTLISAHQSIGVPQPLKMFGTEAQKKQFYPRFRQGAISAFALTEPDVGSDPAQMAAEAKLSADGKHYILNGTKLWCTNGTLANVIVVLAKTAPKIVKGKERKQITAFIVEMNSPGVEVTHRCEFMGLHGIYNALLKFTDVKVPVENRLSEEGRGLAIALSTVNVGRLTLPAACAGAAKQMLSVARRWGSTRSQWGQPVGLHEEGRAKLAFIASSALAIEAIAWLTSSWQDKGGLDIRIEAAMGKLFCTETLWKVVDTTLQLRGGRGYETAQSLKTRGETPYAVERAMRDSRINLIFEGSSEILRLFLARETMDPHLKRLGAMLSGKMSIGEKIKAAFGTLGFYSTWYPKHLLSAPFASSYSELGELGKHFTYVEKTAHRLARNLFYYMARYREKLEFRQMILSRLMEIGADLFAISATVAYAVGLNKKDPSNTSVFQLADYFASAAKRRIEQRFEDLTSNDDRKANAVAKEIIEGKFKWMEEGIIWGGPKE